MAKARKLPRVHLNRCTLRARIPAPSRRSRNGAATHDAWHNSWTLPRRLETAGRKTFAGALDPAHSLRYSGARTPTNATSQDIIYPLQRPSLAAPVTRNALPHKLVTGTGVQIPWSPQDPAFGALIRSNEPTVTRPHSQEPLSEGFLRAYWRFDS